MQAANFVIDVKALAKQFDHRWVVDHIDLQVRSGEIFGFLGPNGSGKTTTIRMLCGLLTPDVGTGTCLGYDILTQSKMIKRNTGYIPQYFSLYKNLTVYENLRLITDLYGIRNRTQKIKSTLEQFGLTPKKNQLAGHLSGGWKQRLSLATALIHDPLLLLLDEPTANVDPTFRRDFWEIMHQLSATGMTILLSSHFMDEVERCHRIAYICDGKILLQGKISEISKQVKLYTWKVTGPNLPLLAKQLSVLPDIEQVVTFYNALHVSGQDEEKLNQALSSFWAHPLYTWIKTESTLDDIFICLSKKRYADDR